MDENACAVRPAASLRRVVVIVVADGQRSLVRPLRETAALKLGERRPRRDALLNFCQKTFFGSPPPVSDAVFSS